MGRNVALPEVKPHPYTADNVCALESADLYKGFTVDVVLFRQFLNLFKAHKPVMASSVLRKGFCVLVRNFTNINR